MSETVVSKRVSLDGPERIRAPRRYRTDLAGSTRLDYKVLSTRMDRGMARTSLLISRRRRGQSIVILPRTMPLLPMATQSDYLLWQLCSVRLCPTAQRTPMVHPCRLRGLTTRQTHIVLSTLKSQRQQDLAEDRSCPLLRTQSRDRLMRVALPVCASRQRPPCRLHQLTLSDM